MAKAKIQTAFKVACLHYKSSDLLFRGMNFSRKHLFEIRRNILDEEWSNIVANTNLNKEARYHQLNETEPAIQQFYKNLDSKLNTRHRQITDAK